MEKKRKGEIALTVLKAELQKMRTKDLKRVIKRTTEIAGITDSESCEFWEAVCLEAITEEISKIKEYSKTGEYGCD